MILRSFLVAAFALAACATAQPEDDGAAIAAILRADQARSVAAWEARDAAIMFPEANDAAVLVSPNGETVDVAALRADLQRRMGMTVSVEEMTMEIVSIEISGDSAIAITNQRFVRTLNQPNGPRQRISMVTHTQRFTRGADGWASDGPFTESNQTARWADEPAP